jgi:uncharacterized protein (DUF362 family)
MNDPVHSKDLSRRSFLRQTARCSLLAAAACTLGYTFWDPLGPQPDGAKANVLELPDYSVAAKRARLAVAHGAERQRTIEAVVRALGGMQAFVRPGDHVLIKVNAAFATPPMLGAATHPDALSRLVTLCMQAGAAEVRVTDNPINDPSSCFALSGIGPAAHAVGARLILPAAERFETYSVPHGRLIRQWPVLTQPLRWADKLIGLSPLKDHHRSGASMTLKNWYGLLGGRRNIFHQQIHEIILELARMVKPTLVILDGTQSMVRNGPTGGSLEDLKPTHTVIAGTDAVAVDALGASLLNKTAGQLPHLVMAEKAGLGTTDYRSLNPVEVNA